MNNVVKARSALNSIDSGCPREDWVRICMAVKAAGLSFEDFHEWSESADNYKSEEDCQVVWDSISAEGGITSATLYHYAIESGWRYSDVFSEDEMTSNIDFEQEDNVIFDTEEVDNPRAVNVWEQCISATIDEPYINRKQGNPYGLKVYPETAPHFLIKGKIIAGSLVIPFYSKNKLITLQFILKDSSEKLNLPGASLGNSYFTVGEIKNCIYLCEGIGQAWAINAATSEAAIVCFGSGRFKNVAKVVRAQYPNATLVIVPDKGKEELAARIATNICGLWVEIPEEKPANYDINDYLKDHGLDALKKLLHSTKTPEKNQSSAELAHEAGEHIRSLTELGNARRLFDMHSDKIRYIHDIKKWLIWKDLSWKMDDGSSVRSLSAELSSVIYKEGAKESIQNNQLFLKWAYRSESQKTISSSVTLLRDFSEIRISMKELDADPFIVGFNKSRKIIDLSTGMVRDAVPLDNVTKSLGANTLGASSKAVLWKKFLSQIFEENEELIEWLQRFFGYLLTGSTKEQVFLFCFGHGANGKSVLSELLKKILGDYATVIAWETLTESRRQAGCATPDLTALIGKRFGLCSETEDNRVLAESLVKGIVSGDSMTVRPLYAAPIEFKPSCKLMITGNHKPIIKGSDHGIWRRVRLLPFNRTFSSEERDPELLSKLEGEIPHILAWMIEGCINWQKIGLADVPKIISEATEGYQVDQDIIGTWISERVTLKDNAEAASSDLYSNYKCWCEENGHRVISSNIFGRRLSERGFNVRKSNGKRLWTGLCLEAPTGYSDDM